MASTCYDRYQITDPICGLVDTETSLKRAIEVAKMHSCEAVEIFDVMAHYDCAERWDRNGNILSFRHRENTPKTNL